MKKKYITYIIAVSVLSLTGLLILQINWILQAARLREDQLKHRVTMASYQINEKIARDQVTLDEIAKRLNENMGKNLVIDIDEMKRAKIAQIINEEFRYHQINLDYTFDIVDKDHKDYAATCEVGLQAHGLCLDESIKGEKAELRITFLNKTLYIYSQMGLMLAASFVLILLVALCFILTIHTIWKQKKLSEMTTDFINNMTHELKTPISTISLASNMLRKDRVLDNKEKIVHYSGVIHDENDKLQNQVEQVLRLARIERGEYRLNIEKINLHEAVGEAIKSIELQVKSRNGQIKCYLNAIKHDILADMTHLTNVVSNLLDNANKYSPENPDITVMTYNREDGVVISVEDKGIGMSKDKQKYIFNKFYRVPTGNIHDVKGFGLGLAYVKMMVDAHKGHIHLKSEPGKGSKFDIFLPLGS